MKLTLVFLSLIFSQMLLGFHFNYPNNKKGFAILPDTPIGSEILQKSGETYTYEGDICIIKWGTFWGGNNKEKCYRASDEKLNVQAYFPDETKNVTTDLKITYDRSKKKWHYKYTTPSLVKTTANRFTLVIGSRDDREAKLQLAKAKIEQLIILFQERQTKLLTIIHDSKSRQRHINYLSQTIKGLQALSARIDKALENSVNTLAHISIPLQVDNEKATAFSYSSNFSGHKMALSLNPGVVFKGESVHSKLRVSNLSHLPFIFPLLLDEDLDDDNETDEDSSNNYRVSFSFNNISEFLSSPFDNDFGENFEKEFVLSRVSPLKENDYYFELRRVMPRKFFSYLKEERKWGVLSGIYSVANDTVAPQIQIETPSFTNNYFQTISEFNIKATDQLGKIETSTLKVLLSGTKQNGESVNLDLTSSVVAQTNDNGQSYYYNLPMPTLDEGHYTLSGHVQDYAGNRSNVFSQEFYIDRTKPIIELDKQDGILTNNPALNILVKVQDNSPIQVTTKHNNVTAYEGSDKEKNVLLTLTEGLNTFEVSAVDAAGNSASIVTLKNITLDTIPPVLTNIKPENNSIISFIQFPVTAKSNEPLMSVFVNNTDTNTVSGTAALNYSFDAMREGPVKLSIVATDLANNSSTVEINAEVLLKVLRPELITIFPHPTDRSKIIIQGSKWSARPGAEISTGVLGMFFTIADDEGKFQIEMPIRSDITLVGFDRILNRTDFAFLTYDIDTTFSGLVYNLDGRPMVGVRVSIVSTNQSALTNEAGVFRIEKPATGDQVVTFDASGISESDNGTMKIYHKTNVAYTLGNNQLNVLEKPIILVPLLIDGDETIVTLDDPATVTSPKAEGFELNISANSAVFPSGEKVGEISVQKLTVDQLNVPPPAYVKPSSVYALEPSGLKFTTPAMLTMPNENEFPPKTQLVIMSKNSSTGIWEIDGLAVVSEDGERIETTSTGGITHFSEVFAAPIAPTLSAFNQDASNGATINSNGFQTSTSLPAIKILGTEVAPTMVYNSSWANPKMIVSNIIAVDKQERTISRSPNGVTRIDKKKVEIEFEGKTWVEPEKVFAWAATGDVASARYEFAGVPNNSLISYALDLTNLNSGYHSYLSQYEIQLKQMIIGTVFATPKGGFQGLFGDTQTSPYQNSQTIEELYPQALPGNLIVQNKTRSPAGRGWKVGMTKEILDVNGTVISIENENGSVKSYFPNNPISTIYTDSSDTLLAISTLHTNKSEISVSTSSGKIKDINLGSGQEASSISLPKYNGYLSYNFVQYEGTYDCGWRKTCARYRCNERQTSYEITHNLLALHKRADGSYVANDQAGAIYKFSDQNRELIAGTVGAMPSGSLPYKNSVCGQVGMSCFGDYLVNKYDSGSCYGVRASSGSQISSGYQDGVATSAQFNKLADFTESAAYSLLIVDTGNNRIRALNQSSNSVTTIAGNGQNYDGGDGGSALSASLYHPLGVTTDANDNIYVSTENGYIRKIDSNGYISTIAGKPVSQGGVVTLSGHAQEMALVRPYGMVVDNEKGILYVADSGNNRVLAIQLGTLRAHVVAGDGTCSPTIRDNVPATASSLCNPEKVVLDKNNNLIVFDKGHNSLRKIILNSNLEDSTIFYTLDQDGSTLEKNLNQTFTLSARSGDKIVFNKDGKQVESTSKSGVSIDYEYNVEKQLEEISMAGKSLYTFAYTDNYLTSITDKANRTTTFDIVNGLLTKVNFPDGTSETYSYDSEGRIIENKDKQGRASSLEYNAYGELVKFINAKGAEIIKSFGQSKVVGGNALSPTELIDYNDASLSDSIVDPLNQKIELKKDFKGYVSSITDQRGLITTIDRDAEGRPIKITRPDNTYTEFSYEATYHDLVKKFDSATNVTLEYLYSATGALVKAFENTTPVKENVYDEDTGLLLSETNKRLNQTLHYEYQELGLLAKKTLLNGDTLSFDYDEWGNTTSITGARGEVAELTRDAAGNVTQAENALSQIINREYDQFNRLLSVNSANGEKTTYEYTLTGQLQKILDPNAKTTLFTYDELDQLVERKSPDGEIVQLDYDDNGNIIEEKDNSGRWAKYFYNEVNKVEKKILPDNTYEFDYDIRGNLAYAKNNDSEVSFAYMHLESGDVISEATSKGLGLFNSLPTSTINYDYDLHGNRTKMVERGQVTSYTYDVGDRLTDITNHKGELYSFDYDNKNRINAIGRPGSTTGYDFYENDMIKAISHSKSNISINQLDYIVNAANNITSITSSRGVQGYGYDLNNQLTAATSPELALNELFTYDSLGNRVTDQTGAYSYNSSKQKLLDDPRYSYVYDLRGNVIQKYHKATSEKEKFTYNSENRLIKYEHQDIGENTLKEATYAYDLLGRRVEKVVKDYNSNKTTTRRFIYDGQEVLLVLDEDNAPLAKFTHSTLRTDDVLAVDVTEKGEQEGYAQTKGSYQYLKDHLGSVVDITNSSGTVVQHYAYSSFGELKKIADKDGNELITPILENHFAYTGREIDDESHLYYYRARMYDPESGRFLSVDPDAGSLDSPLTFLSEYTYGLSNPLKYTDPSGECEVLCMTLIAIGVSTVAMYFDSRNANGDITVGVNVNLNENGEYQNTTYYYGNDNYEISYTTSDQSLSEQYWYEWAEIMTQDSEGVSTVYPEMYLIGFNAGQLLTSRTGLILGYHVPHHTFGNMGKLPHLQINYWLKGVSGSTGAKRVPVPRYFTPTKSYNKRLW